MITTTLAVPAVVDRDTLTGSIALGLVPLVLAGVVVLAKWWRSRDEVFDHVTPGLVPGVGDSVSRSRVRGGEWHGPVAVQFTPPADVSPGVAGTVIDGVAHRHDVSATIVDLAARGWFRIEQVGGASPSGRDWVLHRTEPAPNETLSPFEQELLASLFTSGPTVVLSSLEGRFGLTMRRAQIGLYREVVDRGWYRRHPRARNARTRFWGLVLMVPLTLAALVVALVPGLTDGDWSLTPLAGGGLLTVVVLARWGGTRTARTAEGTAARIQALGFREYLATAEADRLRFEELRTIVTRYLPFAVAFGLTAHFAKLFEAVSKDPRWTADDSSVLDWFNGWDGPDLSGLDVGGGPGDGDFGDGQSVEVDASDVDGFDVDGFTQATDGLFSFDGFDGCGDACDLPGCDF